jgi:hypothetical protein
MMNVALNLSPTPGPIGALRSRLLLSPRRKCEPVTLSLSPAVRGAPKNRRISLRALGTGDLGVILQAAQSSG